MSSYAAGVPLYDAPYTANPSMQHMSHGGNGGGVVGHRHTKAPSHHDDSHHGSGKKGRKPYTITKPRESWTKEEHQFFLEALQLYERDWKKIGAHIPTKSIIQIRSHAQKYFIKMAKMGLKEFIPAPSRPKRAPKGHRSKRRKLGTGAEGEEEDGEDEEDEDGEDDEDEDGGDDEGMETGGEEHPNGLRKPQSSPAKQPQLVRAQSARKAPVKVAPTAVPPRKPVMKRAASQESADADDGTRRSGRKRKMKRRFDDEEYGSDDEPDDGGEQLDMDDQGDPGDHEHDQEHDDEDMPEGDEEHEHGDGEGYPSQPPTPQPDASAPTTPLRKTGTTTGPGISSLSQLSPLSQLTQAGSLADITSPHLLPQSAVYNPKLKPYPGLGRSRGAGGMASNVAHANALNRPTQPTPLAIDTHEGAEGEESAAAEDPEAVQPEFAKVYSFLGSLFDPSTSGHIDELERMNPVNKEIVQKLMQNLTSNLNPSAPQPPSSSTYSSSGDPLSSLMGPGPNRLSLGAAPKHVRTGSLGSIGSLDANMLGSPETSHRWMDGGAPMPSVSPTPPVSSIIAGSSSSAMSLQGSSSLHPANGSPTYLPRTYSSNGLSLHVIPPGSGSGTSGSLSSGLPPAAAPGWSADKSRPGFASSALVSRITARGALSPLSVAPLSSSAWPAQGSPTAPSSLAYSSYQYASMSPSATGTPLSFVGSPGGFFSPGLLGSGSGGAGATSGAQGESGLPQYPNVKSETVSAGAQPPASTLSLPAAALSSHTLTTPVRPAPIATSPSHATTSSVSGATSIGAIISPSSAGNVLASLISSPGPTAKPIEPSVAEAITEAEAAPM